MRIRKIPAYCAGVFLALGMLTAAEHHGVVKFGGLPLPGATVTASQGDKTLSVITDLQGAYTFPDLADGTWKMRVEMLCFEPMEQEVAIKADAPAPPWDLKLLPVDQIKASAPPPANAAPAVSTSLSSQPSAAAAPQKKSAKARIAEAQATKANTASGFQKTDVNASANAAPPAAETAAATPAGPAEANAAPNDGFLINGSVNNGAASPFGQSGAFGNNRRGPRSLYNGMVGLTLRDSFLDARSYSLTGQDTAKPGYTQMQGVASFGGPLKIPRLIERNGPNITINYQWVRNRNATTHTGQVPTADERVGDFSRSLNALGQPSVIKDPTTGLPLPGNKIPVISPQALYLLRFYPLSNFNSNTGYNYQIPLVGSVHQDNLQARTNKGIGRKNSLSGSLAFQSIRSDNTSVFGFLNTTGSLGLNASANWMHRFTQRVFINTGYTFSRFSSKSTPFFANRENVSGAAGITGNNQQAINWGPPALNFSSGIEPLSDIQFSSIHNQTGAINSSLFWAHGPHNFTIGGDFRRQQFNQLSQQDPRGKFTFNGAAAGNDFAGFLLGVPDTSSIAFGNADKYLRATSYDGYVTDDWRVSPALTLNIGVRWEYNAPVTELYGRLVNLDITPGFGAISPVVASVATGSLTGQRHPDSLVNPDRNMWEPRIGLSWRPFLASSMVVRGGYGVYHDTSVYLPIANRMTQQSPLSKSLSVQRSADNPITLANGFNAPPNVITNTFAVDPNFRVGYAQTWQLSVQRDLPKSLVMTATYLGTKGTRAQQQFLPNTYPVGALNPCLGCPSGFYYLTSNGNSTRESGMIQIRRRLHNGFTAQVQYTYAKSIDDASLGGQGGPAGQGQGQSAGSTLTAQDWLNLRGERGRSNFDQRHLLNVQIQYTTGVGLGGGTLLGGWKGGLFKDWTISSQITSGSGLPLTPVYAAAVRGTGITGPLRPDYTGASLYDAPSGLFLNPAAVAAPAAGRWGNAGRNSINGPMQFTLNAAMARTFRFSDRISADFRLDANNALNHVTFPSWNTILLNEQFGLPTSANAMRSVQTNLRVRF